MLKGYHFSHTIRIRYTEIDGQLIILNSNYLNYIVIINTEFFRSLGFSVTPGENWFDIALITSNLEFKGPGYFDDLIEINAKIAEIGNKSYRAEYAMVRESTGEVIFTAQNVYACFDPVLKQSVLIPDYVRKKFEALQPFNG